MSYKNHVKPVAILSTTVFPLDGDYTVKTVSISDIPDITGVPHYIGHPDTKKIVESLGQFKQKQNYLLDCSLLKVQFVFRLLKDFPLVR